MIDVMIDTELMGSSSPRSVICSIAACIFDRNIPMSWEDVQSKGFSQAVSIQSCINAGLELDGKSIEFWLDQNDEARADLRKSPVSITEALSGLNKYLLNVCGGNSKQLTVWAMPASGDLVILESAFAALKKQVSWLGKNRRCLSTLKYELGGYNVQWPSKFVNQKLKHIALFDVYLQIMDAQTVLNKLSVITG